MGTLRACRFVWVAFSEAEEVIKVSSPHLSPYLLYGFTRATCADSIEADVRGGRGLMSAGAGHERLGVSLQKGGAS
eukprot:2395213-Prymnesium_polylepis.1